MLWFLGALFQLDLLLFGSEVLKVTAVARVNNGGLLRNHLSRLRDSRRAVQWQVEVACSQHRQR